MRIEQQRFDVLEWSGRGATFYLSSQPEVILPDEGWQKLSLSSLSSLPQRLETIQRGEQIPPLSKEALFRLMAGSVLHQLYTLGLFTVLGGQLEEIPLAFPTLRPDHPSEAEELVWMQGAMRGAISKPGYQDDHLAKIWQAILIRAEEKMRQQLPLLIEPGGEDFVLDEVWQFWSKREQQGFLQSRADLLISGLQNLNGVLPYGTERAADRLYFEMGVICFIHELEWIITARLDELVSARTPHARRLAFVVDFKSGAKPKEFTEADLAYHLLMRMIGERLTAKYLVGGNIPSGSGWLEIEIKEFGATPFVDQVQAVFRYLEGTHRSYIPYQWAAPERRTYALEILRSWKEQMEELKITSI